MDKARDERELQYYRSWYDNFIAEQVYKECDEEDNNKMNKKTLEQTLQEISIKAAKNAMNAHLAFDHGVCPTCYQYCVRENDGQFVTSSFCPTCGELCPDCGMPLDTQDFLSCSNCNWHE